MDTQMMIALIAAIKAGAVTANLELDDPKMFARGVANELERMGYKLVSDSE